MFSKKKPFQRKKENEKKKDFVFCDKKFVAISFVLVEHKKNDKEPVGRERENGLKKRTFYVSLCHWDVFFYHFSCVGVVR